VAPCSSVQPSNGRAPLLVTGSDMRSGPLMRLARRGQRVVSPCAPPYVRRGGAGRPCTARGALGWPLAGGGGRRRLLCPWGPSGARGGRGRRGRVSVGALAARSRAGSPVTALGGRAGVRRRLQAGRSVGACPEWGGSSRVGGFVDSAGAAPSCAPSAAAAPALWP